MLRTHFLASLASLATILAVALPALGTVIVSREHVEQERNGETSLTLIGLRYEGPNDSLGVGNALNSQGHWPGTTLLNQGVVYFGLVPDEGLGYLEARDDLAVLYDPQDLAAAMLEKNYLPPNVFGRGANRDLQERVFDRLGLKPAVEGGPIEDQLREIADVDEDVVDDGTDDRVGRYVDEYSRTELGDAAKVLRDDSEEFDLRANQSKHDRAAFVAEFDEETAAEALQAATTDTDEEE